MSITGGMFDSGGHRREDPDDDRESGDEGPDRSASAAELIDVDLDSGVLVLPVEDLLGDGTPDALDDVYIDEDTTED